MPKFIDITGMTFGRWTVIREVKERDKFNRIMWECKCECGTIRNVPGISLRKGESKSCGCLHNEIVLKDIMGLRFGNLLALSRTDKKDLKKGYYWNCLCDCGNYVDVPISSLTTGSMRSCGCLKNPTKDITGMKFNMLTAIAPTNKRSGSAVVWTCKCDCGNLCDVSEANLQNGHTKSCGCLTSVGEQKIRSILLDNNIPFESQKMFDTCRFPDTNMMAKFDFYIDNKYLLEYDGYQHFYYLDNSWITKEVLEDNQKRDRYKDEWCKVSNIPLIRIPYTHFNDICIDDIVLETSKFVIG